MSPIVVSSALGALLLVLCGSPALAQDNAEQELRGEVLLNSNCS